MPTNLSAEPIITVQIVQPSNIIATIETDDTVSVVETDALNDINLTVSPSITHTVAMAPNFTGTIAITDWGTTEIPVGDLISSDFATAMMVIAL